jgi:hypothetical protein
MGCSHPGRNDRIPARSASKGFCANGTLAGASGWYRACATQLLGALVLPLRPTADRDRKRGRKPRRPHHAHHRDRKTRKTGTPLYLRAFANLGKDPALGISQPSSAGLTGRAVAASRLLADTTTRQLGMLINLGSIPFLSSDPPKTVSATLAFVPSCARLHYGRLWAASSLTIRTAGCRGRAIGPGWSPL